jgi:RNA polymerase sigma factor (sigma-70 family)
VFGESRDSDERLVARARAGDEHAFEHLHARYRPALLAFCRHLTGQREDAEDAVQYTFLVTYREIVETPRPLELRPWLFTVARNRCSSLLRRRRARPTARPLEAAQAPVDPPPDELERREELRDLVRDLQALPEQQREALLLAEIADLRHAEIARILGVSPAKVKALVFQARSSLTSTREARDADCEDIRSQLATLSGGALRRRRLRRHLRQCGACSAFEHALTEQRKGIAALVPVGAGLELTALGGAQATGGGGAVAGGLAGGLLAAGSGVAAKGMVALVAVAGSGLAVSSLSDTPPDRPGSPAAIVGVDQQAGAQRTAVVRGLTASPPAPGSRAPAARPPSRSSPERSAGGGPRVERGRQPGSALRADDQRSESVVSTPAAEEGSGDGAQESPPPAPEPDDQAGAPADKPDKVPQGQGGGSAGGGQGNSGTAPGQSGAVPPGQAKKDPQAPPTAPPPVSLPPQAQGNPGGPANAGGPKEKTEKLPDA